MAVRETSQRSKQFAYSYFDQVHARVKTLERKRDAQHPKRQPLIDHGGIPQGGIVFRPESSGGEQAVHAPEGEIHAGEMLNTLKACIVGVKGLLCGLSCSMLCLHNLRKCTPSNL